MSGFEFDLKEILEKAAPEVQKAAVEQFKKQVIDSLHYSISEEVQKAARQFIDEEVMPSVKQQMAESKDLLIQQVVSLIPSITQELKDSLEKKAKESLAHSWNVKKVVEGLFS